MIEVSSLKVDSTSNAVIYPNDYI